MWELWSEILPDGHPFFHLVIYVLASWLPVVVEDNYKDEDIRFWRMMTTYTIEGSY